MDLRAYYEKVGKIEALIDTVFAVVISRAMPDGGRSGVKTELPRGIAARLIADGKADLASPEDAARFRAEAETKWKEMQLHVADRRKP
ncbi:MAG TPA: hypothetical protein VLN48_16595 [Bryobacteraceae bacterium]|nr:hypothetical protein [Bryobacteraceae bacterium]